VQVPVEIHDLLHIVLEIEVEIEKPDLVLHEFRDVDLLYVAVADGVELPRDVFKEVEEPVRLVGDEIDVLEQLRVVLRKDAFRLRECLAGLADRLLETPLQEPGATDDPVEGIGEVVQDPRDEFLDERAFEFPLQEPENVRFPRFLHFLGLDHILFLRFLPVLSEAF
jgi:hypothetical protein